MTHIDLKIDKDEQGEYDISFDENGDFSMVDGLSTALQMSLYCERRALESEVPPPQNRRGWWGNTVSDIAGFEMGSKLWLLYQSRLTTNEVNLSKTYSQNALFWLIEDNYFDQIIVTTEQVELQLNISIDLLRNNNIIETQSFELFNNTRTGTL